MSADCPGCWPTPKHPITRVCAHEWENNTTRLGSIGQVCIKCQAWNPDDAH